MSDKHKREIENLKGKAKVLKERNCDLAKRLTEATDLLHHGAGVVEAMGARIATLCEHVAELERSHVEYAQDMERQVAQAQSAAEASEGVTQEHKKRTQDAERKLGRLTKALHVLRDSKWQKKDVEEFVTIAATVLGGNPALSAEA